MKWLHWIDPRLLYRAFRMGSLQRKVQRLREENARIKTEGERLQDIADIKQCVDEWSKIAQAFRGRRAN